MFKVLVVGGYGYLGSVIADKLSNNRNVNLVNVYDKCLFMNEDVGKILTSCKKVESFITSNLYDVVIWAATPDCDEFYSYFEEEVKHLLSLYKTVRTQSIKMFNLSTWELSYAEDLSENFKLRFFKRLEEEPGVINIRIPSLYGASPRMRWDTEINNLIYHALIQNQILLDTGSSDMFPICSVNDAANHIIEKIIVEKIIIPFEFHSNVVNLVSSAHVIADEIGDVQVKYLNPTEGINHKQVTSKCISNFKDIRENVKFIVTQLEKKMLQDFMSDRHNNRTTFISAYNSINFLENLKKCRD